jgi:F420-non-reducing hydrogenase iron-sulfur subunit
MDSAEEGRGLPFSVYPVKTPCAGRIDPAMILSAFERGAEGVLIAGCREDACQFGPGYSSSRKTSDTTAGLIRTLGLEEERFRVLYFESHEKDRFRSELEEFSQTVARLKPSPLAA